MYISQLIRFARVCSHVEDFNAHNKCLTAKLHKQGYRNHKLRKAFSKFYRRHNELIAKIQYRIKISYTSMLIGTRFKNIMGRTDFSDQFRKIIISHKPIGYDLNVLRQSACLVINPITVDNFAAL